MGCTSSKEKKSTAGDSESDREGNDVVAIPAHVGESKLGDAGVSAANSTYEHRKSEEVAGEEDENDTNDKDTVPLGTELTSAHNEEDKREGNEESPDDSNDANAKEDTMDQAPEEPPKSEEKQEETNKEDAVRKTAEAQAMEQVESEEANSSPSKTKREKSPKKSKAERKAEKKAEKEKVKEKASGNDNSGMSPPPRNTIPQSDENTSTLDVESSHEEDDRSNTKRRGKSPKKDKKVKVKKEKSPKKEKKDKKGKRQTDDTVYESEEEEESFSIKRDRKKSMNITAFMNKTIIEIFPDELDEIDRIHAGVGHLFHIDELRRLYADFKMNGKCISRQEFRIVFATFSRTGNSDVLADIAFQSAIKDDSDTIGFEDFIEMLSIMMKGDAAAKTAFSFRLFDTNGDGRIDRQVAIDLISKLPLNTYFLDDDDADSNAQSSRRGSSHPLADLIEEEEEFEDEDDDNDLTNRSAKSSLVSRLISEADADTVPSLKKMSFAFRSSSDESPTETNIKKATQIVDHAYRDLGKSEDEPLTMDDYNLLCEGSEVADWFSPL